MSAHARKGESDAASLERKLTDKVRRIEIATRKMSAESFHGGVQSRFRGRGMDFDELREYAPGDDVRAIDWNASARTGRTFVKKYREERQLTVVFVVDMSASGSLGAGEGTKRDQAIEITSLLALAAMRNDHRVGLVLFTDVVEKFVPPARGRGHTLRLVRDLVAFQPEGRGTNLARVLRTVRERLRRRAVVILLSDFLLSEKGAAEAKPELDALARHHDVVSVHVGDQHDRELPDVGLLTLEDVETGELVEIDTGSRRERERLAQAIRETDARRRAFFASAAVDLLSVDTIEPYLPELVGFFKSRGARR